MDDFKSCPIETDYAVSFDDPLLCAMHLHTYAQHFCPFTAARLYVFLVLRRVQ